VSALVAYIPFLEPLQAAQGWWYLLVVPLAFGISVIYKALRVSRLETFWRQVAMMTTQILIAMVALALALAILVEVVIPMVPVG
jgi:hypothetical protein